MLFSTPFSYAAWQKHEKKTALLGKIVNPPAQPSNTLTVFVEGIQVEALVDTGASISIINEDLCSRLRKVRTPYVGPLLRGANEVMIEPSGQCTARVLIGEVLHHIQFAVLSPCAHQIILGWDFLSSSSAVISCRQPVIHLYDTDLASLSDVPVPRLVASADYVLPPGQETVFSVTCASVPDGDLIAVPAGSFACKGVIVPPCLIHFSRGSALIAAMNTTPQPILLPQGTTVASVPYEEVGPFPVCTLAPVQCSCGPELPSSCLTSTINTELPVEKKEQLLAILNKHKALFDSHSSRLGRTSAATHRIDTDGSCIIRRRPYRVSSSERKIIQENVDDMLRRDIIRPSESSWSSPVVLVRKKDGSVRFCVDYRALNKITRKDVYPMPRIDDALDTLHGAEYFSSLDLRSGYWQIPMNEADKEKTAFSTPDGLYEFNVMPFGLCNAPATFERMIDTVLRGLKWKTCLCYLDDIVIFSTTFTEHLQRLDEVLTCLAHAGLQLNTKKCHFASTSIKVLGHVVSKEGIRPDPEKINAVLNFSRPRSQKELRSFLGLASYFRRFIRNFAAIASPLNKLLTSGTPFIWTEDCETAFKTLKQALTSGPVLCHFDESAPTILHTDASGHGLGAVLLQRTNSSSERVVAYASRTLSPAEKNYTITEKECLAVVWAVQKFRPYLYGRHFSVVTDHHALCWLSSLKNVSGRLGRWILRLQEYDFSVTYKSGRTHKDADALSRCPLSSPPDILSSSGSSAALPMAPLHITGQDLPSNLVSLQRDDTYCRQLIDQLECSVSPPNGRSRRQLNKFRLLNGGALYRLNYHPTGDRWVPVIPRCLRNHILEVFHDDPTAGHLAFHKTYDRIKSRFFWPGLSTSVAKYVASCPSCQYRKRPTSTSAGMLQPLPCPSDPFEVVGIDLYGPLPSTPTGHRWIVTAVDHLTRYAETAPLRTGCASEVADFFLQTIFLRHGPPRVLLSDRGRTFLSAVLAEVLRAAGTAHKTTSSYHPQTNGLTERFHRTLSDMISAYINPDHKNWDVILPFVTYAYNTAVQSTTGFSPFFLVYGRHPPSVLDASFFSCPVSTTGNAPDQFVSGLAYCRNLARLNTESCQDDRKSRYDAARRDVTYLSTWR